MKMKFWIGNDPKCAERVLRVLYSMGYKWSVNLGFVDDSMAIRTMRSLYTYSDKAMNFNDCESRETVFDNRSYKEINIDWLRTPKETVEVDGKTYYLSDVKDRLKELKEVE